MTAVPVRATGAPIPLPSPVSIADALTRATTRPALVAVVDVTPAPTPALIPHKKRLPTEPIPGEPAIVARDRAHWIECNHGRHVWAELPEHLGAAVCRHCPVRADQAERSRAARRDRAGRP